MVLNLSSVFALIGFILNPINILACVWNKNMNKNGFVIWAVTNLFWVTIDISFGIWSYGIDPSFVIFYAMALEKGIYFYLAVSGYFEWRKRENGIKNRN